MTSRYCSQCGKAKRACICSTIQTLNSNLELVILQHPTEEHRPMGTAKILALSLPNSHLFIGEDFSNHEGLNRLLGDAEYEHFVLYPREYAIALSNKPTKNSNSRKQRAILLDGTWKKAYKIWQLSSNLHCLPCVKLPSELHGNYRIRKAPDPNALSTVEAGFHLLSLWHPERDFSSLITTFEKMIEFQIAQMPAGVFERNYLNKKN
ncbi:tRNA-uridine aminocarboxypropyltransferase [Vibrio sp. WJH972]